MGQSTNLNWCRIWAINSSDSEHDTEDDEGWLRLFSAMMIVKWLKKNKIDEVSNYHASGSPKLIQ